MTAPQFRKHILSWHRKNGRHNLPWRPPLLRPRKDGILDPWRVLVSEVMLQQTQVSRVLAKYPRFIRRFPTSQALARASLREVLALWQGMGYNRRAIHLREAARRIVAEYRGKVPANVEDLRRLPGIGANTAGAIIAFAFNRRTVFIETNIRRMFLHHFFARRRRVPDAEILRLVSRVLPARNFRLWYYALMDCGALALKRGPNPNRRSRHYARQPAFRGSGREVRGKIVAALVRGGNTSRNALQTHVTALLGRRCPAEKFSAILRRMEQEGVIMERGGSIAFTP